MNEGDSHPWDLTDPLEEFVRLTIASAAAA